MAKKSYEINMTEGPLFKKIILFAVPLMLTGMLQLFYNAADIVVVGKFAGDSSLAAVGSTTSLINLIVNTFLGLSLGAGVVVAQSIGARNKARLYRTVHTSMLLSVFLGIGVGALGFVLCRPLLVLMGSPADVLDKATLYMRIYFLGTPGFLIYNFGAAILRSTGDTKRPLVILSISGLANIAFNLVFVIYFSMDVAGVALATIISQYISATWVVVILIKEKSDFKLNLAKLHIYKKEVFQIIAYGLPMGIQSSFFSISNVLIQSSINSFGTLTVAGNSAASNIEGFVYTASNSISQTAITFSGQNTGAGKYTRVKKVLFLSLALTALLGAVFGGLVILLKEHLLGIYTDNPAIVAAGAVRINIICIFYSLCGVMDTTSNVTRGMGKSIVPMIITLVFVCFVRAVWVFTIFRIFNTAECIYWSYPVTWGLATIGQLAYFAVVYKAKTKSKINME